MKLFTLFTNQAPNRVFLSILLSIFAGIGNALLIPLLLASVGRESSPEVDARESQLLWGMEVAHYKFAVVFVCLCLFILIARSTSRVLLKRIVLEAAAELRISTYRSILRTPAAALEKLGPSRLLATITLDVNRVATGARAVPDIIVSVITLTGLLFYLLVLNVHVFLLVLGATVIGVITYQIPAVVGRRHFERAREMYDQLHESIRGVIYGNKELKLNREKREKYFREILIADEQSTLAHEKRAHTIITIAAAYGELLGFLLIGATAYIFVSYHEMSATDVIAVVMVLLYIVAPIAMILNSLPFISAAKISLENMDHVFGDLSEEEGALEMLPIPDWGALRLDGVRYHYETSDGRIEIGPVDIEFRKQEITFLVGGNGSGKSSLCKLIALHYLPDAGNVYVGHTKVDHRSRDSCRQLISTVLSDYYLFDRLLLNLESDDEWVVQHYLVELGLNTTMSIEKGRFSRTMLSDGQRKRLALLSVLLEDRDVYVFDEWADNQDPSFKEVFYLKVLPELKAKGKVVIVVSHDDRYFGIADQIVVMESGKCVRKERKTAASIHAIADAGSTLSTGRRVFLRPAG